VLNLTNDIDELEQRVENLELNGGGSSGGNTDIDLTEYAKKTYVDNAINKIQLTPGPKGEKGIEVIQELEDHKDLKVRQVMLDHKD
jgi:polyhydroxyalkanoate synthesis regulator phasin